MVSIVLASHGKFAEGIKDSGGMIFGPQEGVVAVLSNNAKVLKTDTKLTVQQN